MDPDLIGQLAGSPERDFGVEPHAPALAGPLSRHDRLAVIGLGMAHGPGEPVLRAGNDFLVATWRGGHGKQWGAPPCPRAIFMTDKLSRRWTIGPKWMGVSVFSGGRRDAACACCRMGRGESATLTIRSA